MINTYFYSLIRRYLSTHILVHDSVIEVDPISPHVVMAMPNGKVTFRNKTQQLKLVSAIPKAITIPPDNVALAKPTYLVVSGLLHYEQDIQLLLSDVHHMCHKGTRLVLIYYSSLWRPLMFLASTFGWRQRTPESNWLSHGDVLNLLHLENFQLVRIEHKVLLPVYIPFLSNFVNRYFAPLPIFRNLCLLTIAIARPLIRNDDLQRARPSVSIVVPARNEAGNIDSVVRRIPPMGPIDEIIFIEGNSTDDTWETIQRVKVRWGTKRRILIDQQEGEGKGDAVRKGFALASNEILMILDADMTVPPEDLPKFYRAIVEGAGELINGSRLVYPMEQKSMRFLNLLGNKFFAMAFTYVLGQSLKDTLCGTKAISRSNYQRLVTNRYYFGDFDPFGDFDIILGAARMGLKIVEVPICYRERLYGETNIARWRHGAILLVMLLFATRRFKFI